MIIPKEYSPAVLAVLKQWVAFCRKDSGSEDRYTAYECEFIWRHDGIRHADGSATGELISYRSGKVISHWQIACDGGIISAPLTLYKITKEEKTHG